ncbi:hypothetical protein NM688_g3589 [Phlebia brevispora]|uniref:Uncharacterized protein n=1 Tax=Phlebia brevispora TaxID=194682 RepID=A0ACC1T552_9APHY|nr:hypothetical protein NM688_g3589 [Phlebia brevispora]
MDHHLFQYRKYTNGLKYSQNSPIFVAQIPPRDWAILYPSFLMLRSQFHRFRSLTLDPKEQSRAGKPPTDVCVAFWETTYKYVRGIIWNRPVCPQNKNEGGQICSLKLALELISEVYDTLGIAFDVTVDVFEVEDATTRVEALDDLLKEMTGVQTLHLRTVHVEDLVRNVLVEPLEIHPSSDDRQRTKKFHATLPLPSLAELNISQSRRDKVILYLTYWKNVRVCGLESIACTSAMWKEGTGSTANCTVRTRTNSFSSTEVQQVLLAATSSSVTQIPWDDLRLVYGLDRTVIAPAYEL